MKKEIHVYISELLFLHDCVIIPGFGGFVGNEQSAYLNRRTNTIYPPYKQILFNKNLKTNDGLLTSHIANSEKISHDQSLEIIKDFVKKINIQLTDNQTYRIKRVGLLSMSQDDNILFLQDSSINYNLNSFGMSSRGVSKLDPMENEIKSIVSDNSSTTRGKRLLKAAAIMLPIIGISVISLTQQEKINNMYNGMADLNPFSIFQSTKTQKSISNELKEIQLKIESLKEPIPITTDQEKNNIISNNNDKKEKIKNPIVKKENIESTHKEINQEFFLVAGSFSNKENAKELIKQLKKENYDASIIGVNKEGLIRVSYGKYASKNDAIQALNDLKLKNKSGWILSL